MVTTTNRVLEYTTLPQELSAVQGRNLNGRVAVVSGASHGIGRCVALHLAQHGAAIAVNYFQSPDDAETVTQTIRSFHTDVLPVCADIRSEDATQQMVNEIIEEFGRVDILVNNAGINRDVCFHQMTRRAWDEVLSVNLAGVFNLTRAIINPMRQRKYGKIINIASMAGQCGATCQTNYAAAKSAIIGFTKSLARENAEMGIVVNAVAPGCIETRALQSLPKNERDKLLATIPMKRFGRPEEVAQVVGFLASDHSRYITGQIIGINGGQYM